MYQTLHNNTTWGNANELYSNSIFATLKKKEFMTFKKFSAKMVDSPKSADFTEEALKVRSCVAFCCYALKQHHDFDINFSDINDKRQQQK